MIAEKQNCPGPVGPETTPFLLATEFTGGLITSRPLVMPGGPSANVFPLAPMLGVSDILGLGWKPKPDGPNEPTGCERMGTNFQGDRILGYTVLGACPPGGFSLDSTQT